MQHYWIHHVRIYFPGAPFAHLPRSNNPGSTNCEMDFPSCETRLILRRAFVSGKVFFRGPRRKKSSSKGETRNFHGPMRYGSAGKICKSADNGTNWGNFVSWRKMLPVSENVYRNRWIGVRKFSRNFSFLRHFSVNVWNFIIQLFYFAYRLGLALFNSNPNFSMIE